MVKQEKAKKEVTPEKIELFKNADDVMKKILESANREKQDLDHHILLKKSEYRNISDAIVRQQQAFEQWKRSETEKLEQELTRKRNDFIQRENVLRVGEATFVRKMEEIHERERISVGLLEQRKKLNEDRIEVEKLNTKAREELISAQKILDDVNNKIANLSVREHKLKDLEGKVNTINSTLGKREEDISQKEKNIEARINNLEEVKKNVEPKIKELCIIEENIKKEQKKLEEEKSLVLNKIEEESALLKGITIREKKVKDREKELEQKDDEITRKALLAGVK